MSDSLTAEKNKPLPSRDDSQTASSQQMAPAQDTKTYRSLSDSWNRAMQATNQYFKDLRYNTIRFLPALLVNNSSNLLGIHHVWTEIIMFKASLKTSKLVDKASNPIDYAVKAIGRVYTESVKSAFKSGGEKVDIFKGNPAVNLFNFVTDTKAATQREIRAQKVAPGAVKLGNPWQTRATAVNLIGWTFVSIWPEKKETNEEIERMEIMRKTDLPRYIGTRLFHAVWAPEWMTHKRQVIGVTQMAAGICSILGAWRNRTQPLAHEIAAGKLPQYVFNIPYLGTGLCSFLGGTALSFAPDNQTGYREYGNWVMGMTAFLPFSLGEKFRRNEPGTGWYTFGKLSFQANAWLQSLVGGAERIGDKVIDHEELRKVADEKAVEIRAERKRSRAENKAHGSVDASEADATDSMADATPTNVVASGARVGRMAEAPELQQEGV